MKLLMTLPGVDVAAAETLLATLGDITRFRAAEQAAADLGRAPSGEHCNHGPSFSPLGPGVIGGGWRMRPGPPAYAGGDRPGAIRVALPHLAASLPRRAEELKFPCTLEARATRQHNLVAHLSRCRGTPARRRGRTVAPVGKKFRPDTTAKPP